VDGQTGIDKTLKLTVGPPLAAVAFRRQASVAGAATVKPKRG
jgi:hypothetical protein